VRAAANDSKILQRERLLFLYEYINRRSLLSPPSKAPYPVIGVMNPFGSEFQSPNRSETASQTNVAYVVFPRPAQLSRNIRQEKRRPFMGVRSIARHDRVGASIDRVAPFSAGFLFRKRRAYVLNSRICEKVLSQSRCLNGHSGTIQCGFSLKEKAGICTKFEAPRERFLH
jgi:hypothetical protein